MTKPLTAKAAWLKELRTGEEGSAWRTGAEIIDGEMTTARKLLDAAKLPYTARDLVRLAEVLFKCAGPSDGIAVLAKARLDCEGILYGASDLIEMIALLGDAMDCFMDHDAENDDDADCASEVRH